MTWLIQLNTTVRLDNLFLITFENIEFNLFKTLLYASLTTRFAHVMSFFLVLKFSIKEKETTKNHIEQLKSYKQ